MPVAPERLILIRELANDERVDGMDSTQLNDFTDADWERMEVELAEETMAFVRNCTDPEELHAFVEHWNWDKGVQAIRELLRNPACEAATALMTYWHAVPEFYLQFADRNAAEKEGHDLEVFDLIAEIGTRYVAGEFPKGYIAYDPNGPEELRVGEYDSMRNSFVRALPAVMYVPVKAG